MDSKSLELAPAQLRRELDPSLFTFKSTADLPPLDRVIGQERAVRSIDFGIDMPDHGYNLYVVGPPGSGRSTTVRLFLQRKAAQRPVPPGWCYVYNFDDPRRPKAISLPAGRATRLRDEMAELVKQLQLEIPRAFEGEYFEQHRREITLELQRKQQELFQTLEHYLNERSFALIRSQVGLAIAPMVKGEPLTGEAYDKLNPEAKKKFEAYRPELQEQYDKTMHQAREMDRQGKQDMDNVAHELSGFVVDHALADMKEQFQDIPKVMEYLAAVRQDVVQNATEFLPNPEAEKSPLMAMAAAGRQRWLDRYKVNVLEEASLTQGAPMVVEDNPTYTNLIGRIEHQAEFGALVTDFSQIRAGALHRANGGYLVVDAKDLLVNPMAWEGLKRAMGNRQIKIEDMSQFYGLMATASLEPEPIPLELKVVIIGDERMYELLYMYDEDFRELFKVKAQFVMHVNLGDETAMEYAAFVGNLCREEKLRHLDPGAMVKLLAEAARLADDQQKVTTRFSEVADLVRESSFWAGRSGRETVTADDVRKTMDERLYQRNYAAERYREAVQEGIILIDTAGGMAGQINGLSVVQLANYEFGVPSRVTAKTFMGKAGVVSIDREVKMSGPIHDKGQLILSSYLASRFAQKRAMSISASITFEQLYSGVEGDSASSTELYALLSSLSDLPIKQNVAVTGSVNQFGRVQAIGGVNAKIEGFFDLCKARGLTGEQGVMIPSSNVRHLMLREDVCQAVAEGKFHIYAVSSIEDGIELLTGVPAGEPDAEGNYPEGTVYARVQAKLDTYAERAKEEAEGEEEEEGTPSHAENKSSGGGDAPDSQ